MLSPGEREKQLERDRERDREREIEKERDRERKRREMRKRVAKIFRGSVLYISKCLTGFRRKIPKNGTGEGVY